LCVDDTIRTMNSLPITNVLNKIQMCSRSPNKKDEIIVVVVNKCESPPPQKDQRTRKRRVAFDDQVRVFEIHSHTEYTTVEVRACWYSPSELVMFRSDCTTMAFLKNTGEDYCARGLEHLTTLTSKSRKADIAKAMFAVFIEQEMQCSWTGGEEAPNSTSPDELIRATYMAQSRRSKVNARLKGISDQAEAASDHGKEDGCSSRIVRSWKGWLFQQIRLSDVRHLAVSLSRTRNVLPHHQ
jgi:hypothetical protein